MGPPKRGRDLRCGAEGVKATAAASHAMMAGMARSEAAADPHYLEALERLRAACVGWPGVTETTSWGNPTFKANGRGFAVLDRYKGSSCIYVQCGGARREALLGREGWFAAPYDKKQQAACRVLDGLDWDEFLPVLKESYEGVMGI